MKSRLLWKGLVIASLFATSIVSAHDGDGQTTAEHLRNDFGLPTAVAAEGPRPVRADSRETGTSPRPTTASKENSRWNRQRVDFDPGALNVPGRPEFGRIASK